MNDTPTPENKDTAKAPAKAKASAKAAAAKAEDAVTETAAKAEDTAKAATAEVKETAKDTAEKVEEAAKETAEKVEDAAKDAAADASAKANELKDKVMQTLDQWSAALTKGDQQQIMTFLYASYGLAFFFGLPAIAGYVLILRKKRDAMKDSIYESHVTWLDRTFLISAGIVVAGMVLGLFLNAGLIVILGFVYLYYRTIKGFLAFYEKKAIEDPNALY